VRVDNDSMGGDPAPNQPKQLHLQYLYQGRQRSMTVREGNYVQFPSRSVARQSPRRMGPRSIGGSKSVSIADSPRSRSA